MPERLRDPIFGDLLLHPGCLPTGLARSGQVRLAKWVTTRHQARRAASTAFVFLALITDFPLAPHHDLENLEFPLTTSPWLPETTLMPDQRVPPDLPRVSREFSRSSTHLPRFNLTSNYHPQPACPKYIDQANSAGSENKPRRASTSERGSRSSLRLPRRSSRPPRLRL
jgi:hypothetical protein